MFPLRSITVTLVLATLLAACSAAPPAPTATPAQGVAVGAGGGYSNVTPAVLAEMLQRKDFFFVNTHVPYEGEIEQTDAFIGFEANGPQRLSEYPTEKSAKIVLYCRSGAMSSVVASELVKAGYTNVWNLDGGMIAWEQAGYELVRK